MYICDLKLDILLASKNGEAFKILVAIRIKKDDDGTARWGYLGAHDYRMPTGGPFRRQGSDVVLQDTEGKDFALLAGFAEPPFAGRVGGIQVYPPPTTFGGGSVYAPQGVSGAPMTATPGVRPQYAGSTIAWRGSGKWTVLKSDTISGVNMNTWNAFCNNIANSGTEWFIQTTSGVSASGGCGVGWEYMSGTLVIESDTQKGKWVRLNYSANGPSVLTPGAGATASAEWTPCKGSHLVRGPLPTATPFHPSQLTGPCVIVEVAANRSPLPIPGLGPATVGVGGYATLFFFGAQGGSGNPLFTNYKAAAAVVGLVGAANLFGTGGASMNISWGTMTT
jgi:hypothetical protein